MNMSIFETWEAPQLRSYLEFLLWHYRVVDAFWFLYVAEAFDQPTAERINERVWSRVPSTETLSPSFSSASLISLPSR